MSSFPIRARLTAWYAALLTAIIAGLGVFLVVQLRADLRATIDGEVRASSVQIARAYELEGAGDFRDASRQVLSRLSDSAAQIVDPGGRILHHHGELAGEPITSAAIRRAALAGRSRMITVALGPRDHRFRAQVTRVQRLGRPRVLVVAESLREVEDAVEQVILLLLLAGPAALAATALGGRWLARKALLPVERMTSQAEEIRIDRLDERIAVPRARDEIGHLAVTLNAMLDRLEHGVKEKHRLVADASHELRTPLAVMRAELDVSLGEEDLPPGARHVLESVREEVARMSRTVENLLTLAHVDEGRLELLRSDVRLAEAVEAAARPLRPLADAKHIRLEIGGASEIAKADSHRLHQALTNFIENAIKFAPVGGAVHVRSWRRNGEVGVTVSDDGPGIPAEARDQIFDRFYRVDRARQRAIGGSGLGLAICREIASAHGGRVWVDSEEGRGSAFSLALPLNPED
jgi:heavy metal sensor kinase